VADRVAPRDFGASFARCAARECLALLVRGQPGLSPEGYASGLGADAAFAGPRLD